MTTEKIAALKMQNYWRTGVILLVTLMLGMWLGMAQTKREIHELKLSIAHASAVVPPKDSAPTP